MTKGSNGDFSVASFMDYYWNEMSKTIAENIEKLLAIQVLTLDEVSHQRNTVWQKCYEYQDQKWREC